MSDWPTKLISDFFQRTKCEINTIVFNTAKLTFGFANAFRELSQRQTLFSTKLSESFSKSFLRIPHFLAFLCGKKLAPRESIVAVKRCLVKEKRRIVGECKVD